MKVSTSNLTFECVDDVPLHRVRANQSGILVCIVLSVVLSNMWILLLPLVVQIISRTYGIKYNLFVRTLSPLFPSSKKTESRELLRFNSLLAIIFLVVTIACDALHLPIVAYASLTMLTIAVVLALCGFCLGCIVYFQWKQFLARRRSS